MNSKERDTLLSNVISFFESDEKVEVFDTNYQNKFLKVFTEDKKGFAEQIFDILFVDYFDSYQKIILDYQIKYFQKYKFTADYDELKRIVKIKEKNLQQEHLLGIIDKIENLQIDESKFQPIKDSSYEYFKSRSVRNTIIELVNDWKKNSYDSMKKKLEDSLKLGEPKNTGHNYFKDVKKRLIKTYRNPIPFLPILTEKTNGGLAPGELGIVLAPPGGGKSMALVRFACEALRLGKKVVYYSLELGEEVIGQRFDSCLNDLSLQDVFNYPDYIEERTKELEKNGTGLVIQKYNTKRASINTIYSHLNSLKNEGFVPDIIFVDYADLLKPLTSYKDKRFELTDIYEDARGLAGELGIAVWTASQTNRTGINKERFGMDSFGESLGKAATADLVIGVARTDDYKDDDIAKIGIIKNRNGKEGRYFDAIFDTSKIYIEILPEDQQSQAEQKPTKKYVSKKQENEISQSLKNNKERK